jgi:hypothetical protein
MTGFIRKTVLPLGLSKQDGFRLFAHQESLKLC